MVDLGGYVIIIVETKDKKIKLYGKCNHKITKFVLAKFSQDYRINRVGCYTYLYYIKEHLGVLPEIDSKPFQLSISF